jgi:hypothetical protein
MTDHATPSRPVNLAELRDPDFSDGLTASQHLDVLRGGPDPRADQTEGPSLDDVAELCKEFGFVPGNNGALLAADVFRAPPLSPLPMLRDMITAAITRWHAPVAQPAAQPVDMANLMRLTEGVDPYAPGDPDVDHILALAAIIREVDGKHDLGAAALAEAILAHPGFSGCHDGPAALPAQEARYGHRPELDQVARIVYESAMRATAPDFAQPHWPEWCDLPSSDARNHALNTAEIILAHVRCAAPPASEVQGVAVDRYEFSVFDSDDQEMAGGDAATLSEVVAEGRHYLRQCNKDGPHKLELRRVLVLNHSEATNA